MTNFKCMSCTRIFQKKDHLKRHMFVHTGEKSIKCLSDECRRTFSRRDNMIQHFRSVHKRKAAHRKKAIYKKITHRKTTQKKSVVTNKQTENDTDISENDTYDIITDDEIDIESITDTDSDFESEYVLDSGTVQILQPNFGTYHQPLLPRSEYDQSVLRRFNTNI